MAKLNGTDGKVKVGTVTVAELNEWSLDDEINPVTGRAFGETLEQSSGGTRKVTGSLKGFYDDTDATGQGVLVAGALVELNLYPSGDSSGDKYKGIAEAHIQKVSIGASNDNFVPFECTFQANTVPTDETVA